MKTNRYLLGLALLVVGTMPAFSQVSNDNEDEVNKIDARAGRYDFVPGQVLVKFKDDSSAGIQRARGKFRSSSISAVDNLLKDYGVKDVEKLFPNEEAKPKARLRKARAYNGTIVEEKNLDKVFWIKTKVESPDSTMQLIEQLKAMPEVEYAEPNYHVYITADMPNNFSTPQARTGLHAIKGAPSVETNASVICATPEDNALYSQQYGIKLHNIDKLWNKPIINKKRPVIAILDTGVDITHPDLKDNIWTNTKELEGEIAYDDDGNGIVDDEHGWNFSENHYDVTDHNGHGTHVAGIAAACDNNIGIVGANPQALIMPVKVMNDRGRGDIATFCRGIIYAAEMGADIINMSIGHTGYLSQTEIDAIQKAYVTTILVASAGNNGVTVYNLLGGPIWPAAYYLVLGVQCSGKDGQLVSWSNYDPDGPIFSEDGVDGRNHEMMLAGVDIYSTLPGGQYNKLSGTSMSAPLLSGAISALKMVKEYPSKDVMFGDLIHLNADFEKIFSNETPRTPKIDLVALNYDDSTDGNGDGQVDVGETVDFYVVLRNTWADATNIRFKVSVIDEKYKDFVQIENPEVEFGYSLSAYGRETSKTPIRVKFAENIGHNTRVKFGFEIRCDESNETITKDVYVTVFNMVKIGGLIASDMTLTADKNYLVSSNLAIPEGVTLLVEPGTTLKFGSQISISNNGNLVMKGEPGKMIKLTTHNEADSWNGIFSKYYYDNGSPCPTDILEYCIIENANWGETGVVPHLKNCIIFNDLNKWFCYYDHNSYVRCNIVDSPETGFGGSKNKFNETNIVNNHILGYNYPNISEILNCNIFNFIGSSFFFASNSTPNILVPETTSYLGTSRIDIADKYILDIDYNSGFEQVDLSNMRTTPIPEAHGIVWKVVVNGFDAQDESEQLAPLGVGKHKFEVYFNRPMNKAKIPQITFGVREPYTQHSVDEKGTWNEEGTIYTVYKTITGKIQSDGVNRIYVQGAEDDEFFECPYEKTRFNIIIQAAGSMATGFAAEAGLGRVNLTWNNENNDFEDAMGFNIYRFGEQYEKVLPSGWYDGKYYREQRIIMVADTVRINKEIVDIETTEYTDYDVTPGETYYYMYKVLSTDLKEYDISNVVAATPLTATLGDANGSGEVDVADVITTVNYAAGLEPKPFIFEAADMNKDLSIDILDVVGIIQKILNPSAAPVMAMAEATAVYTIEDGVLYVESPVALAGVQVQLNLPEKKDMTVADDLNGFEHTSAWLSDNDYLFLAYNMNGKTLSAGKHALLTIGDAEISNIRLSDTMGGNVDVEGGEGTTSIDAMGSKVQLQGGVFNLKGQKVASNAADLQKLPKGVYIINGEKVVK